MDPGTRLANKYTVYEPVADELLGRIYDAGTDRGERVHVKILHGALAQDDEKVTRFGREFNALRLLQHPCLVQVLDWGQRQGRHYMVLEHVRGCSLRDELAQGPIAPGRAAEIISQVAAALAATHAQGLVHRNLSPQAVMVVDDDYTYARIKLRDFAMARLVDDDEYLTPESVRVGSVTYLSPEYIAEKTSNRRGDVYALGVLFFEMVVGRPPYRGTAQQLMHQTLNVRMPEPTVLRPHLPAWCDELVEATTVKQPGARLSAQGVVDLLVARTEIDVPELEGNLPSARYRRGKVEYRADDFRSEEIAPGRRSKTQQPDEDEDDAPPGPTAGDRLRAFAVMAGVLVALLVGVGGVWLVTTQLSGPRVKTMEELRGSPTLRAGPLGGTSSPRTLVSGGTRLEDEDFGDVNKPVPKAERAEAEQVFAAPSASDRDAEVAQAVQQANRKAPRAAPTDFASRDAPQQATAAPPQRTARARKTDFSARPDRADGQPADRASAPPATPRAARTPVAPTLAGKSAPGLGAAAGPVVSIGTPAGSADDPAQPEPTQGILRVYALQKAIVQIDGLPAGATPVVRPMAPGSHVVTATIIGRPDTLSTKLVTVGAGTTTVDFDF